MGGLFHVMRGGHSPTDGDRQEQAEILRTLAMELYRREGIGESAVSRLEQAAFYERTTNPTLASQQLSTLHKDASDLETPIGGLFADEL